MKFGVIIFPGSNCDHDAYYALSEIAKEPVTFLWHESSDLQGCDAVIVPGGFAYGDYMRTGAIAALAPIMKSVAGFAGICNQGRNVCGMMPHPDRSSEAMLGSADGFKIFHSMMAALIHK